MDVEADIALVGAALANRARVVMLAALLDGEAHPAGDLAREAGIAVSTASSHLADLIAAGLIVGQKHGRQRRYRIRGPQVADAIEVLATIAPRRPTAGRGRIAAARLRAGRTCYDHLAGRLGIAITERLVALGALRAEAGTLTLTDAGIKQFERLGVDVGATRGRRRRFIVPCLDWTEQRHHLGGALGAALCQQFLARGYLRRTGTDRAIELTPSGRQAVSDVLGVLPEEPEVRTAP